ALQGLAETLARRELDAGAAETARAIEQQSLRINAMVHNLLDMARLQSGALKLNRQWQPVDEVVGSSLQLMGTTLARHRVVLDVPATLPMVELDAVLIERVLVNLLENAAKYTPPGSEIRVIARAIGDARALQAGEGEMRLSVEDNGPGLPPGREEALFEKFARGHAESHLPGVGLGLAICRAIMQAHGGSIRAERATPQGGARFSLSLRLGQSPALPAFEEDGEPLP
ncbi:two-component system sensor histidine kinase KdbD, partial [Mitsuaria sp. TWR114]|uniref:ATP-binding protein n=2 Tax=Roseateles TaxID=93681 RepID=UPI0011C30255